MDKKYTEPRKRPVVTNGTTVKNKSMCGKIYVTCRRDTEGFCEVFTEIGKSGGCPKSQTEAISRLVSLALRCNVNPTAIIDELIDIECPSKKVDNEDNILSCADAIAK
jgi:ribonucleoside-diphosphate reductase alpha chain